MSIWREAEDRIRARITSELQGKQCGDWFRNIRCPHCGKREAFIRKDYLVNGSILCPRMNKCGNPSPIRDIFRDVFDDLVREAHRSNSQEANIISYLVLRRGIHEPVVKRLIDAELVEYRPNQTREDYTGPAILFKGTNPAGETYRNGRFLRPPEGIGKGINLGKVAGAIWGMDRVEWNRPIILCEGVIDSLSFQSIGLQGCAYLSAGAKADYKPWAKRFTEQTHLFLAVDGDRAGKISIATHRHQLDLAGIPQDRMTVLAPPPGRDGQRSPDWNDLLRDGKLAIYLTKKKTHEGGSHV